MSVLLLHPPCQSYYYILPVSPPPPLRAQEPIFITAGIEICDEPDGSTLTVHNLQLEDTGVSNNGRSRRKREGKLKSNAKAI